MARIKDKQGKKLHKADCGRKLDSPSSPALQTKFIFLKGIRYELYLFTSLKD